MSPLRRPYTAPFSGKDQHDHDHNHSNYVQIGHILLSVLKSSSRSHSGYRYRCNTYSHPVPEFLKAGDWNKAEEAFKQQTLRDQTHAGSFKELAGIYYNHKKRSQALEAYEKYINYNLVGDEIPSFVHGQIGELYRDRVSGDKFENFLYSEYHLEEAIKRGAPAQTQYEFALLFAKELHDAPRAIKEFNTVLSRTDKRSALAAHTHHALGVLHENVLKEYKEAHTEYKAALAIDYYGIGFLESFRALEMKEWFGTQKILHLAGKSLSRSSNTSNGAKHEKNSLNYSESTQTMILVCSCNSRIY